jgi:hypothetical protein
MGATNRTTQIRASQFVGSDKPSWEGDYNSDMKKIDDEFIRQENLINTQQAQINDLLTRVATLEAGA